MIRMWQPCRIVTRYWARNDKRGLASHAEDLLRLTYHYTCQSKSTIVVWMFIILVLHISSSCRVFQYSHILQDARSALRHTHSRGHGHLKSLCTFFTAVSSAPKRGLGRTWTFCFIFVSGGNFIDKQFIGKFLCCIVRSIHMLSNKIIRIPTTTRNQTMRGWGENIGQELSSSDHFSSDPWSF